MTITRVQSALVESPDLDPMVTTVLGSPATAGNLILGVCSDDKNALSWTAPAGDWFDIVNHCGVNVSLWAGFMVAAGGETTFTLGFGAPSAAGAMFWVAEYADDGTGEWCIQSRAINPSDETAVTAASSGTAPDAIGPGLAVAAFAIDSGTSGAAGPPSPPTYTNSFVSVEPFLTGSAGGIAIAELAVAAGASVETTQTHGPTADQKTGAVFVIGRRVQDRRNASAMEAMRKAM